MTFPSECWTFPPCAPREPAWPRHARRSPALRRAVLCAVRCVLYVRLRGKRMAAAPAPHSLPLHLLFLLSNFPLVSFPDMPVSCSSSFSPLCILNLSFYFCYIRAHFRTLSLSFLLFPVFSFDFLSRHALNLFLLFLFSVSPCIHYLFTHAHSRPLPLSFLLFPVFTLFFLSIQARPRPLPLSLLSAFLIFPLISFPYIS